ncbi:DMT family transporter [Devosia rhodophyticola]|uniref:DMT family transporter n=1 Tax=Devosia rhodophyticola TaxID=3026423 RepID=A0ABY7Z1A0_9HYPH|nr:DMT family transporter [Devosia rhodophyticola]WDR07448.1 DMT family transporter [Devosia rhodophyticola]
MTSSPNAAPSASLRGAAFMFSAGLAFAGVNVATQWAGMVDGLSSTAIAFWQYFIALLFALPLIWREGFKALATNHPGQHIIRVVLAAAGVQVWVFALTHVAIWQVIALSMTSPFFVMAGAGLFLGERITLTRVATTLVGFTGALIIIAPWSETFSVYSLLPVLAAALWAGTSLLTKRLTRDEAPASIAIYLMLLLTPINAALWIGSGLAMPPVSAWAALAVIGVLTAMAQYFMTRAYAVADAAYLQPFDDLKLPLNVILGWLVFAAAPSVSFWPGALLIVGASLFLMRQEDRRKALA